MEITQSTQMYFALCTFFVHATAETWFGKADTVSIADLVMQGSKFELQNCGSEADAMQVDSLFFNPFELKIDAVGVLNRDVTSGTIVAKAGIGSSADGTSLSKKVARRLAFLFSGSHTKKKPLCHHLAQTLDDHKNTSCPIRKGIAKLPFALDSLPSKLLAGSYSLETRVTDELHKPVMCFQLVVNIPRGPKGELVRQLRAPTKDDCIQMMKDQAVFYLREERPGLAMIGQSVTDLGDACIHAILDSYADQGSCDKMHMNVDGATSCATGAPIVTSDICEKLASCSGKTYHGYMPDEHQASRPRGCVEYVGEIEEYKGIWFNEHPVGSSTPMADQRLVCSEANIANLRVLRLLRLFGMVSGGKQTSPFGLASGALFSILFTTLGLIS